MRNKDSEIQIELKTLSSFKEVVLKDKDLTQKQKLMLVALAAYMGNISRACMEAGCSRDVHYNNLANPAYVKYMEFIQEGIKDFAEDCLYRAMDKLDASMIKFYLQSKAKDREYQPDAGITINNNNTRIVEIVYEDEPINISHEIQETPIILIEDGTEETTD